MDFLDRKTACALRLQQQGIQIRFEDLQGAPSGLCQINGQQTLMIDLAMSSADQLEILESVSRELTRKSARSVA